MKGEASALKAYGLHIAVVALLFVLSFVLPPYHHGLVARIMVLATFAMGYNLLFGFFEDLVGGGSLTFSNSATMPLGVTGP